ncbi:hypothetical protein BC834DRAFT_826678 [Gloeopeniophorella convolvens]|nr:hypothetical protein BC834DRAFT_826678 [Gloeopeniophorella convolvens]
MPPTRTKDRQNAEASTSRASGGERAHKRRRLQPKEGAPVGVSKIKSALRQTRRLLAKEGLAANVRVETERKLKALEADLATAERANKERALAVRYHKIKFFDRQKVLRKIKQTNTQLEDDGLSSKRRKKVEAELFELRVDLNYVMNYPKTEKYISLFPPEARQTEGAGAPVHTAASSSVTDDKREKLREWVREQMRVGEMTGEPEMLEHKGSLQKSAVRQWDRPAGAEATKKSKILSTPVLQDDFFEDGNGDDEDAEEPDEPDVAGLPTKRKRDKAETKSSKHSAKREEKSKRRKHKDAAESVTATKDAFFQDDNDDEESW